MVTLLINPWFADECEKLNTLVPKRQGRGPTGIVPVGTTLSQILIALGQGDQGSGVPIIMEKLLCLASTMKRASAPSQNLGGSSHF